MATILWPSTVPCPQISVVTPAERRALSNADRPREARALQRDRLDYERVTWPPLDQIKSEAILAFWRDTLHRGGAWFVAEWPVPQGRHVQTVRKFREQPKWQFVPGGFWQISALCEVRGRGELPLAPDPYTVLLLHMDSDFSDVATGKAPTVFGSGAVVTADAQGFGGYSGSFDGSSRVEFAAHADFNMGAGDFTIEGYITLADLGGPYYFIGQIASGAIPDAGNTSWGFYAIGGNIVGFLYLADGGGSQSIYLTGAAEANVRAHFALVRQGADLFGFWNGVLAENVGITGGYAAQASPLSVTVGSRYDGGNPFIGRLDEIRVSKGIARYTETFTPPTESFSG